MTSFQRVREWFNNHSRATRGTGTRKLLNLTAESKQCMLAPYQAYSRMFNERLGPIISTEWEVDVALKRSAEEDETLTKIPPVPINFRNSVLKRLLQAEPPEIHEAIEEWRKGKPVKDGIEEEANEDTARFAKAEQYHW